MSGVALTSVMALLDPAPMWRFIVTLPQINGVALGPQYVMHVDLPLTHIYPEDEHFANTFLYHPTQLQVEDITMSFYVDSEYTALAYLEEWRQLVFDPQTGDIGLPVDFKKNILVEGLDVAGNSLFSGYCQGCWPTSRIPLTYDGSSAHSPISLNVNFKCEAITYTFVKQPSISGAAQTSAGGRQTGQV